MHIGRGLAPVRCVLILTETVWQIRLKRCPQDAAESEMPILQKPQVRWRACKLCKVLVLPC